MAAEMNAAYASRDVGSAQPCRSSRLIAAGVGFEPTIEVAPDAGFQDGVLVIHTSLSTQLRPCEIPARGYTRRRDRQSSGASRRSAVAVVGLWLRERMTSRSAVRRSLGQTGRRRLTSRAFAPPSDHVSAASRRGE